MSSLKIAVAQINCTVGDLAGNVTRIAAAAREAQTLGADLLLTPELALCGYPPEDLLLREDFYRQLSRQHPGFYLRHRTGDLIARAIIALRTDYTGRGEDSTFAAILEQVRNSEFNNEIARRVKELEKQYATKEEAVRTSAEKDYEKKLSEKDLEMSQLRNELTEKQGIIDGFETAKKLELAELETAKDKERLEVVGEKDKKIAELESQISKSEETHKIAILVHILAPTKQL